MRRIAVQALFACSLVLNAEAAEVSVAVAGNFAAPMQEIAAAFTRDTGHRTVLSYGATGSLYSQIVNGAPYQVLLSADAKTPERLEREGLALSGTRFTYAVGKLALWSRQPGMVDDKGEVLRVGNFDKIALANPKLAPYGAAAVETLQQLGLFDALQEKYVQGESITQTYQFVASENAPLGFVALSQIVENGALVEGSAWIVPADLYTTIQQDAVILANGKDNPAATALATYLKGEKAISIICSFGYEC